MIRLGRLSWLLLVQLAGLTAGCGASSTTVSGSAGGATASSTPTPAPTPTPTPSPTATPTPATGARIEVPSLALKLPLSELPCDKFSAAGVPDPPSSSGYFVTCTGGGGGFYGVIALRGGTLQPVATAPSGTAVKVFDPSGHEIDRTLDSSGGTTSQNPDGTWPGHGVPPGQPVFIELRGSGQQTERSGAP